MRAAVRELREILRLTWRLAPRPATAAVLLAPTAALSIVGSAAVQRALINTPATDDGPRVLLVAIAGGLVFASWLVMGRLSNNLWSLAGHSVIPAVRVRTLQQIDGRARFEDLGTPAYADDVERLRRDIPAAVEMPWVIYNGILNLAALGVSAALLVSVDWRLSAVVVGAGLALLVSTLAARRTVAVDERLTVLRRHERRLHESCVTPRGVQETRSYDAEAAFDARASRMWREVADAQLRSRVSAMNLRGLSWVVLGGALVLGVVILSGEVARGTHTVGDVVLLIVITLGLQGQLSGSVMHLTSIGKAYPAVAALARLRERATDRPEDPADPVSRLSDGIRVERLEFRYAGSERSSLTDVDLEIPAGAVLAIVGQNGAGKSTLANLLLGILPPTEGRILVDGEEPDQREWRRSTAGAFQDFMKPRVSLGEAVGLGDVASIDDRDRVAEAVARVGGAGLVAGLPAGLDTSLSEREGTSLSHGQWQTVALARSAMRTRPALVVLDEPSSALDAHAEHEMFTTFIERGREAGGERGTISIVISHRYSAAYLADLIVVVERGRVIEQGTHAELMALDGRYRRMYELQRDAYLD